MYVHLLSVDKMVWVAITNEPFISKSEVNGVFIEKIPKD